MADIKIGSEGVKAALARYTPEKAIAEYVWNGFDADATHVEITFEPDAIGGVGELIITDNGTGINYDELNKKFKPFLESEKANLKAGKNYTDIHGMYGVGRLTFQSFALQAEWDTTYQANGNTINYSIQVRKERLDKYYPTQEPKVMPEKPTGTRVTISNIYKLSQTDEQKVRSYLVKDFCWYLELNRERGYKITINGEPLEYKDFLLEEDHETFVHADSGTTFEVSYYQWAANLNEYSKFYYIGSDYKERYKENTSFNNKGDSFFHSVLIRSSYLDDFDFNSDEDSKQAQLVKANSRRDKEYKFLREKLNELLRNKRSPYLSTCADQLITELENDKAIPMYDEFSPLETFKKSLLVDTLKQLYVLEPKLFSNLNIEQKLTFTRFINLALEQGGRESLFRIIDDVINLTNDERERLAEILDDIKLDKIIKTVGMLDDRKKTIDDLKRIVFDENLDANESNLQSIVEANTWIFGEQYNVTAAEDMGFDAALRRYRKEIQDKSEDDEKIDHDDAQRQIDLFITRQRVVSVDRDNPQIENILIELKSPSVKLGKKELSQVEDYMRLIRNTDQFNSKSAQWTFLLIGNEFLVSRGEKRSYIEDKIEPNAEHGKDIAIYEKSNNYMVKVKTWGTVFDEFEIAHDFMYKVLQSEQKEIEKSREFSANEITDDILNRATSKELDDSFPHIKRKIDKVASVGPE